MIGPSPAAAAQAALRANEARTAPRPHRVAALDKWVGRGLRVGGGGLLRDRLPLDLVPAGDGARLLPCEQN